MKNLLTNPALLIMFGLLGQGQLAHAQVLYVSPRSCGPQPAQIVAPTSAQECCTPAGCCQPALCKECVPVPGTPKTHTEYCSRTIDFCVRRCTLCGGSCDADCVNCGRPRTKHVMLKRVVTDECPTTKCEVSYRLPATSCQPDCRSSSVVVQGPAQAMPSSGTRAMPRGPVADR
jgi:hypothetical protein